MKVRTILVVASVAALGGYALYDYYSPDSRRARELHIVETLKPDEQRLVPYAVELSVRVLDNVDSHNEDAHRVLIRDGRLEVSARTVVTSAGM